ncbi:SDR family NAD(P)-dependent oxidoreductase [Sinomonas soli]
MRFLVTGAGGGIGSAISKELENAGHEVLRHDLRSTDAQQVDLEGDLIDVDHLARVRDVCRDDGVDGVVCAHGIAAARDLSEVDRAYSDRVMKINTISMLRLYDALSELLTARRGVFVAISSQAGLYAEGHNGAYSASKFAVVGWARGIREHGSGPRLRILCPGATETPLLRQAFEGMAVSQGVAYEDVLSQRSSQIPAGRLGRPSDLGAAALWLAELHEPKVFVAAVTGGEVLY